MIFIKHYNSMRSGDTCKSYPRHTEEYEGLRELSLSLSCPEAAKIILSCKEPVRFLEEETDEEDDFEEFDFMMFSQLEDTRDVLFSILQDRSISLTLRMEVCEQLAESYQICMEEQREFDIDNLLRECKRYQKEGHLQEFVLKCLAGKGVNAASLHQWERQKKNYRFFGIWNACVRNGIKCLMGLINGFIRQRKRIIITFVMNFTKCMVC